MQMLPAGDAPNRRPAAARKPGQPRRVAVETLMRDAAEVILVHRGADYRLRITANGKLILTK